MTFPPSLNRRHKAALFLALIAVGVGLLLGAGVKQSLGIALLGMAFAWAFGSDSRPVHWLFVVAGTVLAFAPLVYQWYDQRGAAESYQSKVAAFESDIPALAKQYPILDPNDVDKVPTGIRLTREDLFHQFRLLPSGKSLSPGDQEEFIQDLLKKCPNWRTVLVDSSERESERAQFILFDKAIAGGLNWAALPYYILPGDPPEPFKLSKAVSKNWLIEIPGVLAVGVGLGLVLGVRHRPN
jgi:hypothetical protein